MKNFKSSLYIATAFLFVAVTMTVSVKPVEAVSNGKIVYSKLGENEVADIFTMNSDGSDKIQLTSDGLTQPYGVSFSPDGRKIVFSRSIEGEVYKIVTMNSDGSQLMQSNNAGLYPSWLPNSSKAAYFGLHDDDNFIFETMDVDGSNVRQLADTTVESEIDLIYDWTSDSSKVARSIIDSGLRKLKISNSDGSNSLFLTNMSFAAVPNFSKNDDKIYFVGSNDTDIGEYSLYSINIDGSNQVEIANLPDGTAKNLQISPDGNSLLYAVTDSETGNDVDVYVMSIDGTNRHTILPNNLSSNEITGSSIGWSPDSTKLVFPGVGEDESLDVYTVNADGSNLINLTNTVDVDEAIIFTHQAWAPVPITITDTPDTDNDGTPNFTEDAAPNIGDANNDGIKDSLQSNVTSLVDPVSGNYAALAVSDGCTIESLSIAAESTNKAADAAYDYPNGMMDFNLDCGTPGYAADISQYYYKQDSKELILRKYNPATKAYATIDSASISTQSIAGQTVAKATYQVKDGGSLDLDNTVDGKIKDPSGLGAKVNSTLASTGDNQQSALIMVLVMSGLVSVAFAASNSFRRRKYIFRS